MDRVLSPTLPCKYREERAGHCSSAVASEGQGPGIKELKGNQMPAASIFDFKRKTGPMGS
jgi:hypothetical protein